MHKAKPLSYPEGRRFAFTIIDDTDCATVANTRPVYELLHNLGFRTTKTIWPLTGHHPEDPNDPGQAVTDPEYLQFIRDLQAWGFEIALHNVRSYSSERREIEEGLRQFQEIVGYVPRVHANHMFNLDGLYWGEARLDLGPIGPLYRLVCSLRGQPTSQGHVEGSRFFWGDISRQEIAYVRGFTFPEINVLSINSSLPYFDPKRPYVRSWFSGCDASNASEFRWLLQTEHQERLEREGGISIVATHLASGFVNDGKVDSEVERLLRNLAGRPGWFVPVGELLDYMVKQRGSHPLPWMERQRMQWRWLLSRFTRRRRRVNSEAISRE